MNFANVGYLKGSNGLKDGCQRKFSNSAKILAGNFWYHTQRVSGRLDIKKDFKKNCWKQINYFHGIFHGGVPPSHGK